MSRESTTRTETTSTDSDSDEYHTADKGEMEILERGGLLSEGIEDMAHLMEPKDCGEGHQVFP